MVSCLELQRWAGSIRLLAIGLALTSCGNSERMAPPADGTLIVSTSTVGDDPDQDGFRLTIDGVDSVVLRPTDRIAVTVPVGRHALELVGVAEQCSVAPSTPLDVDIAVEVRFRWPSRSIVHWSVPLSRSGRRGWIPTRMGTAPWWTALIGDPFRQTAAPSYTQNPAAERSLLPGSHRIVGLTGPASRTVTTIPGEATPVEFAIRCTATTGVINVSFTPSGTDVEGTYQVIVDGLPQYPTRARGIWDFFPGRRSSRVCDRTAQLHGKAWAPVGERDRRRAHERYGSSAIHSALHPERGNSPDHGPDDRAAARRSLPHRALR